jgi:hypothetical protein
MWRPPKRLSDPLTWNFGSALRLANYWLRSANPPRKQRTNLAFFGFFRQWKTQEFGIRAEFSGSAKLGDSNTRKADALREKSLHRNPARLRPDRRAMRGAWQRHASKMARKLPQNRGPRSASMGRGNRGTMLRSFLALLACLERAAGPAGPTAALPQISPMEPIKTPFPRTQRRPLESGSPAQRSAATRLRRLPQQHRAHHSGKDQSRFPRWGSSLSERDPALGLG